MTTSRPTDTAGTDSGRAGWVLATVGIVQFLVSLDLSLINVALPAIQVELGLSDAALNSVVVAYLLVYGGFLMVGGRLGDLWGRRPVLLGGLGVFAVASVVGGLATGPELLIAARALQGLGAAAAAPVALALIAASIPEGAARSRALGIWGAASIGGGAVGVVLSGVLTSTLGWRSVMLVNVPIALLAIGCALKLPASSARSGGSGGRPDVLGGLLVTLGSAALILGVSAVDGDGWGSPLTLGLLGAGVVVLAAFVVVERRVAEPIIRLGLFAHRSVLAANVFGFLITAGQLAAFFFVSLHMQTVLGYTALQAGLAFLPFCLGSVIGIALATRTLPRTGPGPVLVGGGLLGAIGIAWFGLGGPGGSFVTDILGPSLVASIGIGAGFVAMGGAATTGVPPAEAGMASGLLNTFRLLGGSIGLAVLGSVAASVTGAATDIAAVSAGYRTALFLAAGLLVIGSLFCLIIPRRRATVT